MNECTAAVVLIRVTDDRVSRVKRKFKTRPCATVPVEANSISKENMPFGTYTHICMCACIYIYMHVCMYACMYAQSMLHVCIYASMYICMYVRMYAYVHV